MIRSLVFEIGDEYNPLAIRTRMRKPICKGIIRELFRISTIGLHPPELHPAAAHGIEVDVFPVRTIFRPIVQPICGGQSFFITASHRYRVYVIVTIARSAVGEGLSVRTPAVPVRRHELRYLAGLP